MSGLNRRWAVTAVAIGAAAIATSGVAMATAGAEPDVAVVAAAHGQPTATPTNTSPTPIPTTATKPARPGKPTAPAEPEHVFLGEPVKTGVRGPGGELVFRFTKVDVAQLPGVHFGLLAGRTNAQGVFDGIYSTNETEGSDKAPGFHGASVAFETGRIPAFGYYSGPAAKITAKIGGNTVQAHQADWSEDASIKVWWFDYSTTEPSNLAAFDAAGKPLPLGNNQFGRG
ncbi:hypothetical protein [Alloactinosynnema sp. L-07]|uniref:hypothetical protein n=1 Tax=Alloactinosynnema sp. L-07 TaxID=1653480 RepID=UPI00065EF176|nr:hypothetical protein [Alloactinosynnema sp. L-07]CRK57209.1 hypothetical protein [Alloactinosynnema sp. L-07]